MSCGSDYAEQRLAEMAAAIQSGRESAVTAVVQAVRADGHDDLADDLLFGVCGLGVTRLLTEAKK